MADGGNFLSDILSGVGNLLSPSPAAAQPAGPVDPNAPPAAAAPAPTNMLGGAPSPLSAIGMALNPTGYTAMRNARYQRQLQPLEIEQHQQAVQQEQLTLQKSAMDIQQTKAQQAAFTNLVQNVGLPPSTPYMNKDIAVGDLSAAASKGYAPALFGLQNVPGVDSKVLDQTKDAYFKAHGGAADALNDSIANISKMGTTQTTYDAAISQAAKNLSSYGYTADNLKTVLGATPQDFKQKAPAVTGFMQTLNNGYQQWSAQQEAARSFQPVSKDDWTKYAPSFDLPDNVNPGRLPIRFNSTNNQAELDVSKLQQPGVFIGSSEEAKDISQRLGSKDSIAALEGIRKAAALGTILSETDPQKRAKIMQNPLYAQETEDITASLNSGRAPALFNIKLYKDAMPPWQKVQGAMQSLFQGRALSSQEMTNAQEFLNSYKNLSEQYFTDSVAPDVHRLGELNGDLKNFLPASVFRTALAPDVQATYDDGRQKIKNLTDQADARGRIAINTLTGDRSNAPAAPTAAGRSAATTPTQPGPGGPTAPPALGPGQQPGPAPSTTVTPGPNPPAPGPRGFAAPVAGGVQMPAPGAQTYDINQNTGLSPDFTSAAGRVGRIESNNGRASSNIFQFMGDTAKKYGVNDATPPAEQEAKMRQLTAANVAALHHANVPVNDVTAYMAHQQGAGGAVALMRAPNEEIAANIVGAKNAQGNKPFFYGPGGQPLTVAQSRAVFAQKIGHPGQALPPVPAAQSLPTMAQTAGTTPLGATFATPSQARPTNDDGGQDAIAARMAPQPAVAPPVQAPMPAPPSPAPPASGALERAGQIGADSLRGIGQMSGGNQADAAWRTYGQRNGKSYTQNLQDIVNEQQQASERSPVAHFLGNMTGLAAGSAALGPEAGPLARVGMSTAQGGIQAGPDAGDAAGQMAIGAAGGVLGEGASKLFSLAAKSNLGQAIVDKMAPMFRALSPVQQGEVADASRTLLSGSTGTSADAAKQVLAKAGISEADAMHLAAAEQQGMTLSREELANQGDSAAAGVQGAVGVGGQAGKAGEQTLRNSVSGANASRQAGYSGVQTGEAALSGHGVDLSTVSTKAEATVSDLKKSGFNADSDADVAKAMKRFQSVADDVATAPGDKLIDAARSLRVLKSELGAQADKATGKTAAALGQLSSSAGDLWGDTVVTALGSQQGGKLTTMLARADQLHGDLRTFLAGQNGNAILDTLTRNGLSGADVDIGSFIANSGKLVGTRDGGLKAVNAAMNIVGNDADALAALKANVLSGVVGDAKNGAAAQANVKEFATGPRKAIAEALFSPEEVQKLVDIGSGKNKLFGPSSFHMPGKADAGAHGGVLSEALWSGVVGEGAMHMVGSTLGKGFGLGFAGMAIAKGMNHFMAAKLAGSPITFAEAVSRAGAQNVTKMGGRALGRGAQSLQQNQ